MMWMIGEIDWSEIIEHVQNNLVICDAKGIILYTDKAIDKMYLKQRNELIGRSVYDLERDGVFQPSISKEVIKTRTKQTLIQETKIGKKVLLTANPIFDTQGKLKYIVSYSHDVTELVQLKEYVAKMEKEMEQVRTELKTLKNKHYDDGEFLASSPLMNQVLFSAKKMADFDVTVLLTGESGTGKTKLAKYIHRHSTRKNGPLVEINCGTIPESLLESELFGYESGSFSGAKQQGKKGLVEMAEGGTLFLDEIGELPLNLQVKLLTLIQEKKFYRVGGTKPREVDFRLIAATNVDIQQLIKAGRFRQDLYFRLSVVPIHLPSLRDRPEDILAFILEFTNRFNKQYQLNKTFHPDAIDVLSRYEWPGNVRELENMIERIMLTTDVQVIRVDDLPAILKPKEEISSVEGKTLQEMLEQYEARILGIAYDQLKSTTKVAKKLGISQATVVRKLQKYRRGS
jgi:TyrR family helix-turn-helix protein/PAS domain S-box-containing protein